jgi:hypothetical protein
MDAPTIRTTPESPIRCELPLPELAARRSDLASYADRWMVQAENTRTLPVAAFQASL